MTVPISTNKVTYQGNGVAYLWDIPFSVTDADHVRVYITDETTGVLTKLDLNDGYSVSLESMKVQYPASLESDLLPSTKLITLRREVSFTQDAALTNQGGLYPKTIETVLDNLTMMAQELKEEVERSVKVTVSSEVSADELIGDIFEASATAVASASTATSAASTATTKAGEALASASTATTKAGEASSSAATATTKAGEAAASELVATTKAGEALASANTATTKASEASASAGTASGAAATATTKAGEAADSADTAETKAAEAVAAAASLTLPPLTGNAGRFLRVKADESGYESSANPSSANPLAGQTFTYDTAGKLTTAVIDGTTYAITYDAQDRLDTISDGSTTMTCVYNAYGQFTGTTVA